MWFYRVISVCVTLLLAGDISESKYINGAVQFRIKKSEFNRVASVLMKPPDSYNVNERDGNTKGMTNKLSYECKDVVETSNGEEVHVQIPEDGKIVALTYFTNKQLTGKMKITSFADRQVVYEGDFNVTLKNVTLRSNGDLGVSDHVVPSNSINVVNLDFSNCSADINTVMVAQDTVQNIAVHVTEDDLKEIFQNMVCSAHKMRYSLGFGESRITFRILDQPLIVGTEACGLEIKNKTIMITQKVKTTFAEGALLPDKSFTIPPPFPPLDITRDPFQIVIHVNVLNELFRNFKQTLGIGVKKLTVADLLPNLKDIAELDTDGFYMNLLFPMVRQTYPNAVGTIFVKDADIYCTISNGSLQMRFDIVSDLSITLNCDKNRTYSAFNFTMNLYFPAQVGYDNKYLTIKVLGFGGNFTVFNSTVGHVVDRQTRSLLYAVPYYASDGLDTFNDKMQGIPLADFLPEGVFATVRNISVEKDSVVVGGSLSLTDPQLPLLERSEVTWVGKTVPEDDLYLHGIDHTSDDLKPEKEKNCIKPPDHTGSATIVTYQTMLLCIVGVLVYMF